MIQEQEVASIIKFMLDSTNNPHPYYEKVPQSFMVPAAYFPSPEIVTDGDTINSYGMDYAMYVKFFADTSEEAYQLGRIAVMAIRGMRNMIPLVDTSLNIIKKKWLMINDPALKIIDAGVAQVTITWRSRHPYFRKHVPKMMEYEIIGWQHPDIYIKRGATALIELHKPQHHFTDYRQILEGALSGTMPGIILHGRKINAESVAEAEIKAYTAAYKLSGTKPDLALLGDWNVVDTVSDAEISPCVKGYDQTKPSGEFAGVKPDLSMLASLINTDSVTEAEIMSYMAGYKYSGTKPDISLHGKSNNDSKTVMESTHDNYDISFKLCGTTVTQ